MLALGNPIGMAVFGPLADVISVESLLIATGAVGVAVMTIAIMLPSGRAAVAAARAPSPGSNDDGTPKDPESDPEEPVAGFPAAAPGQSNFDDEVQRFLNQTLQLRDLPAQPQSDRS